MNIASTLNNGAVVLDRKQGVVLCFLSQNAVTPYVTWAMGGDGSPFSGHYFQTLPDAVADFKKRLY